MKRVVLTAAILLYAPTLVAQSAPNALAAQTTSNPPAAARPTLQAVRVASEAPVIDGRMDEAAWAAAPVASDFIQFEPNAGEPSTQRTEARVLYDDEAVYVAMRMFDTEPDSIIGQLSRRDNLGYSDAAHVTIDSYYDRRTAFHFVMNPRGVKLDIFRYEDTNEDSGWDAVWDGATTVDSAGWTAEFRIPFSQLRFSPSENGEQRWGINFAREIARRGELSLWAKTVPEVSGIVSVFGDLHGLSGVRPKRQLEVVPYTLARNTRAPGDASNPFYESNEAGASVGADLKYGVTSNLTLTATINPDFGQVEADPAVVNLSAYETFFSEQRPFFVEGADIFRFGEGDLFYSRRIGRSPQRGLDGVYVDAPDASTILAATKLSGKTASGWSVGVLDALTAEERGTWIDDAGASHESVVEPMTNYMVARVNRDLREGKSAIGGIFTATNRRHDGNPELDFLRTSAYSGGTDFRHRFGGGNYNLTGYVVGTHVRGSETAIQLAQRSSARYFQRPDADYVEFDSTRTSLTGFAGKVEAGKDGGNNWRWQTMLNFRSPEFEPNDLGFMQSADQMVHAGFVGYHQQKAGKRFRRWNINLNEWYGTNFGGERIDFGGNINGSFQLNNFWGSWFGVGRSNDSYAPSQLRGGPLLLRDGGVEYWGGVYSDERKMVQIETAFNGFRGDEGAGSASISQYLRVRPSERVNFSVSPSFSWREEPAQYVTRPSYDGTTYYIFGELTQRTFAMTTRLSYTFTPDISLQFYAQPFVSAGDYEDFREVTDPRAKAFNDRYHTYTVDQITAVESEDGTEFRVDRNRDGAADIVFGNPDFNVKSLRSNLVARWEYRPGSTIFLVWSHGRSAFTDTGRFRFNQDFDELFGTDGTNVLLIKASYWLSL